MPEPEHVRAFISIHLDDAVLEALQKFQHSLTAKLPRESVRWSAPEQLHLTLKFLGNVSAESLPDLKAAMHPLALACGPLQLRAEGLGAFPSLRNPRVIWIGLQGDVERLQDWQEQLARAVNPWAQKEENRAFHPHLTLGRIRETASRHARQIGQVLQDFPVPAFGEWRASQFFLMRSQLSPKGAVHTILESYPLRGSDNFTGTGS